ncbi:MAG: PrsW family glutamic-type intramembrane protease [Phycisphaerae bacterium]
MSPSSHDPSVFEEPNFRGHSQVDPSESLADELLRRERARSRVRGNEESVFDEPDFLPGRAPELITRDWCCSRCGYNLRGLRTGDRCPECGRIELYRPPPPDEKGYASQLQARINATTTSAAWRTTLFLALVGGPWAVVAAFLPIDPAFPFASFIPLHVIFTGPIVEEVMKIGVVATVLEIAPHRFRHEAQIRIAAVGAAFSFAAIENLIYTFVYFPNHSVWFAIYRWTVCVALHVGCTSVATGGLIGVWRRTKMEGRRPIITRAIPALLIATVLHAAYNLSVLLYEIATR